MTPGASIPARHFRALIALAVAFLLGDTAIGRQEQHSSVVAQDRNYTTGCAGVNWPSLQSNEPVYRAAMDFAVVLADAGFTVQCVAPSKMAAMFDGQVGAALYRTTRGSFEALFLPNLRNFDALQIVEREQSDRYLHYLYSFAGRPKPWPANLIDSNRRLYFVKHLNRLIATEDEELAARLRSILLGR